MGIKVPDGNQSLSLKRESDTTTEWSFDEVGGFMTRTPRSDVGPAVRGTGDADFDKLVKLVNCVAEFVESCTAEELSAIKDLGPTAAVPLLLDRRLLQTCRAKLDRWLDEPEKHQIRRMLKEQAQAMP